MRIFHSRFFLSYLACCHRLIAPRSSLLIDRYRFGSRLGLEGLTSCIIAYLARGRESILRQ